MRKIHATWEKRNLNLECYEFYIQDDDTISEIKEKIVDFSTDYKVVKVPLSRIDISFYLQDMHFKFIELISTCSFNTSSTPILTSLQKRIIDNLSYDLMSEENLTELYDEISKNMFISDRVSLDPHFTLEIANKRYIGWIKDEIKKGGNIYKVMFKGQICGFFTLRYAGNQIYNAALGGIYEKFQNAGFGLSLHYFEIMEAKKLKAKKVKTHFSSNNRPGAAIHFALGYTLGDQYYVYIKHNTP